VKKVISIFLFIIYATNGFGVTIDFHYCGNKLTKISALNFGAHGGCDCSSNGKTMNCRKDKFCYQICDNHNLIQPVIVSKAGAFSIALPLPKQTGFTSPLPGNNTYPVRADVNWRCCYIPLFLLNSVFRI
jgi:hypothetical protein